GTQRGEGRRTGRPGESGLHAAGADRPAVRRADGRRSPQGRRRRVRRAAPSFQRGRGHRAGRFGRAESGARPPHRNPRGRARVAPRPASPRARHPGGPWSSEPAGRGALIAGARRGTTRKPGAARRQRAARWAIQFANEQEKNPLANKRFSGGLVPASKLGGREFYPTELQGLRENRLAYVARVNLGRGTVPRNWPSIGKDGFTRARGIVRGAI